MGEPNIDDSDFNGAIEQYNSSNAVKRALQAHSQELLYTLDEDDILGSTSVNDLPVENLKSPEEYGDADSETLVSAAAASDGTPTAHIMVSTQTPDHEVLIVVQPQVERSYAVVDSIGKSDADDQSSTASTIYDPTQDDVTTEACVVGQVCKICNCDSLCGGCLYEVFCCDANCYWGDKLKNYCTYDIYSHCCTPCNLC